MLPRDRGFPLRRGSPRVIVRPSTLLIAGVVLGGVADGLRSMVLLAALTGGVIALHGAVQIELLRRRGVELLTIEPSLLGPLVTPTADAPTPELETRDGLKGAAVPTIALTLLAGGMWLWPVTADSPGTVRHAALPLLGGYAILQAMPGLPMEGGRVFHALVWYVSGSATVATRAAARYAQLIAAGLVLAGLFMLPLGGQRSYWSVLFLGMGWQLSAAAASDAARSVWQRRSRAATLQRFIPGVVLPPSAQVGHAARLILGRQVPILVWENRRALGVVTRQSLRQTPRAEWHLRSVAEVMTPIDDVPHLSVDHTVAEAVELLRRERNTVMVVTTGSHPRAAVLLDQLLAPLSS